MFLASYKSFKYLLWNEVNEHHSQRGVTGAHSSAPSMNTVQGDGENRGIQSRGLLLRKILPRKEEGPSWAGRALELCRKARPAC